MTREEYVVLGDVVGSREITDREEFRETIKTALQAVNERYRDDLVAEFALVKGIDEVAGVVAGPQSIYRLLRDLVTSVRPGAIRFAVVHGEIDVGADGDDVGEMDGPAFHRADEELAEVAETGLYISFTGEKPELDPLIATCVNLLLMVRENWTDRQRAMVSAYEETGTQEAVAARFGVSQQTVSATLHRADWPRIEQLEESMNGVLDGYNASGDTSRAATARSEAMGVEDGGE